MDASLFFVVVFLEFGGDQIKLACGQNAKQWMEHKGGKSRQAKQGEAQVQPDIFKWINRYHVFEIYKCVKFRLQNNILVSPPRCPAPFTSTVQRKFVPYMHM